MNEFLTTEENAGAKAPETEFYLGTVVTWGTSGSNLGVQIKLDGDSSAMTKRFKMMCVSRELPIGARVLVMKQSGTYIVLGEIGDPKGYYHPADLPSTANTTDIINRCNLILAILRTEGIIWNP